MPDCFKKTRPSAGDSAKFIAKPAAGTSLPLIILAIAVSAGVILGVVGLLQMNPTALQSFSKLPPIAFLQEWLGKTGLRAADDPNLRLSAGVSEADIHRRYAHFAAENTPLPANTAVGEETEWLLDHAPGLEPFIRLHAAARYVELPHEGGAQQVLAPLLDHPVWGPTALYATAQSQVRANMPQEATTHLMQLRQKYPQTEEATGALYYLAELSAKANPHQAKSKEAQEWAWQYLKAAPTGRFAALLAPTLAEQPTLTGEQRGRLALAYLSGNQPEAALTLIQAENGVTPNNAWIAALAAMESNNTATTELKTLLTQALQTRPLIQPNETQWEELFRGVRRWLPEVTQMQVLQHAAAADPAHADALLWQRIQLQAAAGKPVNSQYADLLNQYPESDYAPESLKQLIWADWQSAMAQPNGPTAQTFIQRVENFLGRYPYASAAAELAYWQGKLQEARTETEQATQTYLALVRDYPYTYYGFRAQQRLNVLRPPHKADSAWQLPGITAWPDETQADWADTAALSTYPGWKELSKEAQSVLTTLVSIAQTTEQGSALDDAALLLRRHHVAEDNILLATLEGQADQWQNLPHTGVRRVYDALKAQARSKQMAAYHPEPWTLAVLYPVLYRNALLTRAQTTGVPALLGLSLMREESFFNPEAVSSSNALGLMQLLPTTAKEVATWEALSGFTPSDLTTPNTNIHLGMRYLQFLKEKFDPFGPSTGPMLMVGAYNGGPNAMARWASASRWLANDPDVFVASIPYEQTRLYIQKVYTSLWLYQQRAAMAAAPSLETPLTEETSTHE